MREIRPTGESVHVKKVSGGERTIALPDNMLRDWLEAEVIAAGYWVVRDKDEDDARHPIPLKPGERVLLRPMTGMDLGDGTKLVHAPDVVCVVDEGPCPLPDLWVRNLDDDPEHKPVKDYA